MFVTPRPVINSRSVFKMRIKRINPYLIFGIVGVLVSFCSLFFQNGDKLSKLGMLIFIIGWSMAFLGFIANALFISRKLSIIPRPISKILRLFRFK